MTVGELADLHNGIISVRSPTDVHAGNGGQRTYRVNAQVNNYETPAYRPSVEPKAYFRENSVKLASSQVPPNSRTTR